MRLRVLPGTVAAAAVLGLSACAAVSNPYSVTIRNDISRPVMVWQCDEESCEGEYDGSSDFHDRELLDPGESVEAGISTRGIPNPWLVTTPSRERLGCLPLVMPEPVEGVVALVSELVPCRAKYDQDVPWPRRRPPS